MGKLFFNTGESIVIITDIGDNPHELAGRSITDVDIIGDVEQSQQWKRFVAKNILLEVSPNEAAQIQGKLAANEAAAANAVDTTDDTIIIDLEADLRASIHDHEAGVAITEPSDADVVADILGGDESAAEIANEITANTEVKEDEGEVVNEEVNESSGPKLNREDYLKNILSEIDEVNEDNSEERGTIATVARPQDADQNRGVITTEQREMGRVEGDVVDPRFIKPNVSEGHAHS